ncbi:hypothetical protein SK128_026771 [Halocaridina rubra]|uniref:CWF19-like protein 2 n=1 Tax=Halocaridina rubra TaxID=373956 RepID=A0AAN9A181_HALRR
MSLIDFESAREKERKRQWEREARSAILEKAKNKYESDKLRDEARRQRGEHTWMLPSVESKLHSDKKKKKKEKKKKKAKKKTKNSSSSSSESDGKEVWVEKQAPGKSKTGATAPATSDSRDVSQESAKREGWMEMTSLFKTYSRDEMREREGISKKKEKEEEKRKKQELYQAVSQARELNPYYKDGGSGLPQEEKVSKSSSSQLGSVGLDASWLRKALQRAREQAEQENTTLEEIAARRWGSLEKFNELLAQAEGRGHNNVDGRRNRHQSAWRRRDRSRSRERERSRNRDRRSMSREKKNSRKTDRRSRSKEMNRSQEKRKRSGDKRSSSREKNTSRSTDRRNRSRERKRNRSKDMRNRSRENRYSSQERIRSSSREKKRSRSRERHKGKYLGARSSSNSSSGHSRSSSCSRSSSNSRREIKDPAQSDKSSWETKSRSSLGLAKPPEDDYEPYQISVLSSRFHRPGDGDRSKSNVRCQRQGSSGIGKGWQKKEYARDKQMNILREPRSISSSSSSSSESDSIEECVEQNPAPAEDVKQMTCSSAAVETPLSTPMMLTDKEMNELAAKIMKAELVGNDTCDISGDWQR